MKMHGCAILQSMQSFLLSARLFLVWHLLDYLVIKEFAVSMFGTFDTIGAVCAPLFEEERGVLCLCLVAEVAYPLRLHRPSQRTTLSANDKPIDTGQIHFTEIFEQRFAAEELDGLGLDGTKCFHARFGGITFDGDTEPSVTRYFTCGEILRHTFCTFSEKLIAMLRRLSDSLHDTIDEVKRHIGMEKV